MRLFGGSWQTGYLMDPVTAIASGIGAVGSLIGGALGSNASKQAGTTLANNAQQVNSLTQSAVNSGQGAVQAAVPNANSLIATGTSQAAQSLGAGLSGAQSTLSDIYNQELTNINPYLATGQSGLSMLNAAVAPGGSLSNQFAAPTAAQVQATPGYEFTLDQGTQAIMRNAAATGLTGGTLKNINQFAEGTASQYYQQAYNNALNTFSTNRNATMQNLQTLLGQGNFGTSQFQSAGQNYGNTVAGDTMQANSLLAGYQNQGAQAQAGNVTSAASQTANLGIQGAQIEGNALTQGANATAASQVGSANAWSNAIGGVANAAQYGALTNALQNAPAPSTTTPPGFIPYASANPYVAPATAPSYTMPSMLQGVTPPPAYAPNSLAPVAGSSGLYPQYNPYGTSGY